MFHGLNLLNQYNMIIIITFLKKHKNIKVINIFIFSINISFIIYIHLDIDNELKECLKKENEIFKARKYWYNVKYFELNESISEHKEMKEYINNISIEYNNKLNDKLAEIECNFDCTQYSLLNGECNTSVLSLM